MAAPRRGEHRWTVDAVYELFPRLAERKENGGTQLSGGEQQMLAIGRALLGNPKLLIMDEPSEGLAPTIIEMLIETFQRARRGGPGDPRGRAEPRRRDRDRRAPARDGRRRDRRRDDRQGARRRSRGAAPLARRAARMTAVSGASTIVLLGTLDTKGDEYAYLRDRVSELGMQTLLVDVGVLGEPRVAARRLPRGGGPRRGRRPRRARLRGRPRGRDGGHGPGRRGRARAAARGRAPAGRRVRRRLGQRVRRRRGDARPADRACRS